MLTEEEIQKILKDKESLDARSKELEKANKELAAQLEKLKDVDPVRLQELEAQAAKYEETKLEEQRQYGELKERWNSEKATFAQQIAELQGQLQQNKIVYSLEKAFYSTGGKAGNDDDGLSYFDLIRDRATSYIKVTEDGKLSIIDPRDGTAMRTDKGNPYTVEDLMLKFRTGGPTTALFEPIGNGAGSGMSPSRPGGGGANVIGRDNLTAMTKPGTIEAIAKGEIQVR